MARVLKARKGRGINVYGISVFQDAGSGLTNLKSWKKISVARIKQDKVLLLVILIIGYGLQSPLVSYVLTR